jgi:hypothetical protein
MLHLGGRKVRNASGEICVRSRRSAGAADHQEHNIVLTPAADAVAIFEVIAGCDPADPVIAASQGKRANSYLRFLDKDGASAARGWAGCTSCSPPRMPIRG